MFCLWLKIKKLRMQLRFVLRAIVLFKLTSRLFLWPQIVLFQQRKLLLLVEHKKNSKRTSWLRNLSHNNNSGCISKTSAVNSSNPQIKLILLTRFSFNSVHKAPRVIKWFQTYSQLLLELRRETLVQVQNPQVSEVI